MDRLPAYLALLSLLVIALQGAAAAPTPGAPAKAGWQPKRVDYGRRIIVSFADHRGELGREELLERKVMDIGAKPGVVHAKALKHVGMAVITCQSMDVEERLVRELEEDPSVELATPDTLVYFDSAPSAAPPRTSSPQTAAAEEHQPQAAAPPWTSSPQTTAVEEHQPQAAAASADFRPPESNLRQCSAQPRCAALNLAGNCCPASDGLMLACCDQTVTSNLVAFRSFFGKYVVAHPDGSVFASAENISAQEKFELIHNDDGSVSLRSHYAKYVVAEAWGGVNANRNLISDWEKFRLIENSDGTVSLKTFHGTYFVAEPDGRLNADRRKIGSWESFSMVYVEGPTERFPDDTNFTALWGMHNEKDTDIDAPEAWKTFTGEPSAGVVVAVIDTGIDYNHEDLWQNMWSNPNEIPGNGIDDDNNGFIDDIHGADFVNEDGDPMDDQKHGTHCAGTIAGIGNNALGVTGVAWRGVRLMALKFLSNTGSGRTSDAVKAIEYAIAHGAKILSNSWGSGSSSAALRVAIQRADTAGTLFVAAAGNSASNNDESPHYPSSYPGDGVIAVASTDVEGELSGFSCYGATSVDLAAPGTRIFSTVPNQGYKFLSGTSMATPHVSGLAALVWMYRPALSMPQVKEVLMRSVDQLATLEGKMVTGGLINAKKALDMAATMEPMYPPVHAPKAIAFKDSNPKVGVIGGVVTITAAADESDVDYYKVYWLSRAGFQLDSVGNISANGAKLLEVPLPSSTVMPKFAVGLVAVSGNATGEMPARLGLAPDVTVRDYGVPEEEPLDVEWRGDEDLRSGMVAGTLVVARAADESSITQYNLHWSQGRGEERGPLLGSIPAIGFLAPTCTGDACPLINQTSKIGWHEFDRLNYGDNELATISFTGPGMLSVTRFDTENYYDTLTIGTAELSGKPRVPINGKLNAGRTSAKWFSDDSISASGWTFEITQTEAKVEFRVAAGRPLGRGVEVVPTYDGTEMPRGIFIELADYDSSMPPSPAFKPTAILFEDRDADRGVIAGVATVVPSEAAAVGSVEYYQLNFADADGATIGQGWRLPANGSSPVSLAIPAMLLPPKAEQLVARAGNSFGLGIGQASTELKDLIEHGGSAAISPPSGDSPAPGRPAAVADDIFTRRREEMPSEEADEPWMPWIPASAPAEGRHVVWTSKDTVLAGASSPRGSFVRSAITIEGLDAAVAASSGAREALRRAIAAALPGLVEDDVKLLRILTVSRRAPKAEAGVAAGEPGAVAVEFVVAPAHGATATIIDRVESRLIMLSQGGGFARRFGEALLAKIAKLPGARLPEGARVAVQAPQQLAAEQRGRRLGAALPEAALSSAAHPQTPSGKMGAASAARALASLAGVAVCGFALLAVHKLLKRSSRSDGGAEAPLHV